MPLAYDRVLQSLNEHKVEYLVLGATAAIAHGAPIATLDLDLFYRRSRENCKRLAGALQPFHPRPRGMDEKLPFTFDAATLFNGCNFTLTTDAGDVDLLGEIAGLGGYEQFVKNAVTLELFGHPALVMSLKDVIKAKKHAGRPKDLLHLITLEATLRLIKARKEKKPKS